MRRARVRTRPIGSAEGILAGEAPNGTREMLPEWHAGPADHPRDASALRIRLPELF
jgi:hypothetical protein